MFAAVASHGGHSAQNRICSTLLNRNPLDLIQRNLIAGAIIELGRTRAFMRCHGLRVFERAAGFEIGRDARSAKRMASNADARVHDYGDTPSNTEFTTSASTMGKAE